jgi:hypothetical protein
LTVLRRRLSILSEVAVEHGQDETLDVSGLGTESVLSAGLGPHGRRELHARIPFSRPRRLLAAILRPNHGVIVGNAQIAPSVQRDVSEIAETALLVVREAPTVVREAPIVASEAIVQIDLNGSEPSDFNVECAAIVKTVDSDVAIALMELRASVERAQVVLDSTTDESVRAVRGDRATRMGLRVKVGALVLSSLAMSVELVVVGQTTALANVQTEVMTDSMDAQALFVAARGQTDEGNLEIALSPLRGQT